MLYIGAVFGGPEAASSEVNRTIDRIMCMVADQRDEVIEQIDGSLNVVFHVPGSLSKPTYKGLRTGRFVRKERMLMVQVAVPETLLDSEELPSFLFRSIREAIHIAKLVFKKCKIDFSVEDHLELVDQIKKQYESSPSL